MAAKTYHIELANSLSVFPGFTTGANGAAGCVTIAASGIKQIMQTPIMACASSYKFSASSAIANAPNWFRCAHPIAFPNAMDVTPTSFKSYLRKASIKKFYLEAYNSAGVLQATSIPVTEASGATGMFTLNWAGASPISVPAGGFLVLRGSYSGVASARCYLGANAKGLGISGQLVTDEIAAISGAQASISVTDGSDVASIVADVQKINITHVFKDASGTNFWADGINVVAYDAATMSNANPTVCGNALIGNVNVGIGEVQIDLISSNPCVLVPDHAHASAPTSEQAISEVLTPQVI